MPATRPAPTTCRCRKSRCGSRRSRRTATWSWSAGWGGRSAQVVNYLLQNGWDNVRNLTGGMKAWETASREMVTDDGAPARVI